MHRLILVLWVSYSLVCLGSLCHVFGNEWLANVIISMTTAEIDRTRKQNVLKLVFNMISR